MNFDEITIERKDEALIVDLKMLKDGLIMEIWRDGDEINHCFMLENKGEVSNRISRKSISKFPTQFLDGIREELELYGVEISSKEVKTLMRAIDR